MVPYIGELSRVHWGVGTLEGGRYIGGWGVGTLEGGGGGRYIGGYVSRVQRGLISTLDSCHDAEWQIVGCSIHWEKPEHIALKNVYSWITQFS